MNEISPQNEREVLQQSAPTDSMPNQRSGGVKKWFREKLEKLRILSPQKESNITEHIRIGRPLKSEDIYSFGSEGFVAGEKAFRKWLTPEMFEKYKNQWVIFTGRGLVASTRTKLEARIKVEETGFRYSDCTIRHIRADALKDTDLDMKEIENT